MTFRKPRVGQKNLLGLGRTLRDIRKCAGVQVTQIAREYGISQGYLTEVELEQKDASMRVLLIYSKKFSIPISDIFIKYEQELYEELQNDNE